MNFLNESWDAYVLSQMEDGICQDCAIVEFNINYSNVWAAHKDGALKLITPQEIDVLACKDRETLFTKDLTLGSVKCVVIRDNLFTEGDHTMDMRTKSEPGEGASCPISVGKSKQVLVLAMGKEGIHGGKLNVKVHEMVEHLKKAGY